MSNSHSYAQIPASETQDEQYNTDTNTTTPFSLPLFPLPSSGYVPIHDHENLDEIDELDDHSSHLTLHHLVSTTIPFSSSSSTAQKNQDPNSEISVTVSPASSSSSSSPSSSSSRSVAVEPSAPTRPKFPAAAGARKMIQQTMDGVFSNLSAKPRVEQPVLEELPPPYKAAAMDQSPAYYETTVMAPFYSEDEILVDGLPVGGLVGFIWNMIISTSFQFVGFFLTYLLHTSHATKNGSKMGLGITFVTMGMQMMSGKGDEEETDADSDTGYMGNTGDRIQAAKEFMGLSYFVMILGFVIMLHSSLEFLRAKRTEMVVNATSSPQADNTNVSVV
ncbi:hypothetical protein EC991_007179 [Linnemannia zychae]|nr:hypothetical protein EC991_007179 [Linnemannia zychae]